MLGKPVGGPRGEYRFVQKIINDGNYLYILTDKKLDRIDLTADNIGLGNINPVMIADEEQILPVGAEGTFLDVVISEKLGVIATNNQIFRTNDLQNVQNVGQGALWQLVATPEGTGPVRQLTPISSSGRGQDVSKGNAGGNLYALSAYRGKNQSQIFRYSIAPTETAIVTGNTIKKLPDIFVKNIPSFFASFGIFRNIFATDGSLYFGTRSQDVDDDPVVTFLTSLATGSVQTGFQGRPLFTREINVGLENSTLITAMLKNSASGSWIVASDNGLRINE